MNPVPSYGGNVCCTGIMPSRAERSINARWNRAQDILVYTTRAVAGRLGSERSDRSDAVCFIRCEGHRLHREAHRDVDPDGVAYNLDETILTRARYRDSGFDRKVWMENGKVYKLTMTPMVTSNYFAAGHRLRIEISSSNFPTVRSQSEYWLVAITTMRQKAWLRTMRCITTASTRRM